jgi:hypothetical protein
VLLVWSGALKIDVASALWHSTALEASRAWKAMRERFMEFGWLVFNEVTD